MTEDQTLICSQCGTTISADELSGGLAVRVDGNLVCQLCVDTLPGEAVVRINQVRAMRGLEATTYAVKLDRLPRLQLFSFTTSSNVTGHRRKLASDGFYEAPPLPPPAERQRAPTPSSPKVVTDRVARGQLPARKPMLIAAGGTLVVLIGIACALALARPDQKPLALTGPDNEVPTPGPPKALKTRLDYPVDPLQAWTQAAPDRDCPTLVLQLIGQELVRKRSQQLDDAELALAERRIDDATALANASSLPEDISFRELRRRENDLRTRLLNSRTVATIAAPVPPQPVAVVPPTVPVVAVPAADVPPPAPASARPVQGDLVIPGSDGSLRLLPETADLIGTSIGRAEREKVHTLINWKNGNDQARWRMRVTTAGNYRLDVRSASGGGDCLMLLQFGALRLPVNIPPTGDWSGFRTTALAIVTLPAAGEMIVQATGQPGVPWRSLHLAEIRLVPTSDTALAVVPAPAAQPDALAGAGVTPWKGAFVTGARDKPPREVALDGSEHLPPGLPGGVAAVFRSSKSQALKRHAVFLDLANANAHAGGVVVLVHPGRNDRNLLVPSLTDAKGVTVTFPPMTLPDGEWTPLVLPMSAAATLDASQLVTLALEDDQKAAQLPEDGGFFIAKAVSVSGRAATSADLGLRISALLPDPNRMRNLPRLLEILAKNRKRPNAQKLFEPVRIRFLVGASWAKNTDWRMAMKKSVGQQLTGNLPNPTVCDITFTDAWLDGMTKSKNKDAMLDPQTIHLAVIWTGGDELTAFPDATQAMTGFWKKRLDQLIDAGILPIVVIGPNQQKAERRMKADQLWQQFTALPAVRQYSLPVIDLRALPITGEEAWDPATATLAGQLVVDGLGETVLTLRRLGVVK